MRAPIAALCLSLAALAACRVESPPSGLEAQCADSCREQVHACSRVQCVRECRFILDKLVEREGARVLACVARSPSRACDDVTFADCAVRVGPNADGGPPPPSPPSDKGDDDS